MPSLQRLDTVMRQLERVPDLRERERIRLATDLDKQRPQHGKRQWQLQLKAHPATTQRRDTHTAAHALDHVLYDVQPHTATRNLRYRVFQREARQKQKLQQLRLGHLFRDAGSCEFSIHDHFAHAPCIQSRPIIRHDHLQHPCCVARFESDDRLGRFALPHTVFGHLTAMIHGIADQMRQRSFKPFKDVPIHLRRLTRDLQSHRFSQAAAQITHHAREALRAVTERTHPRAQHLQIKPVRETRRASVIKIKLVQPVVQIMARLGHLREEMIEFFLGGFRNILAGAMLLQRLHRLLNLHLHPLEPLHGFGERTQPPGFDKRFTRERQQPIEILCCETQVTIWFIHPDLDLRLYFRRFVERCVSRV